jgi:hypothetical protein
MRYLTLPFFFSYPSISGLISVAAIRTHPVESVLIFYLKLFIELYRCSQR